MAGLLDRACGQQLRQLRTEAQPSSLVAPGRIASRHHEGYHFGRSGRHRDGPHAHLEALLLRQINTLPQKTLQDERHPTTALQRRESAALIDFLVAL